jgi:hypothetical protein
MSLLPRRTGHAEAIGVFRFVDQQTAPEDTGDPALYRVGTSVYLGGSGFVLSLASPIAAGATTHNIADPGASGAIPVTRSGVCNITTAAAETRTLAAPTFEGQTLTLCMNVDGGDAAITVASAFNQAGNTVITLNDAGDTVNLVAARIASALRWRIVNNDGASLS